MTSKELFDSLIKIINSSKNIDSHELNKTIFKQVDQGVDALDEKQCRDTLKVYIIDQIIHTYMGPLVSIEKMLKDK